MNFKGGSKSHGSIAREIWTRGSISHGGPFLMVHLYNVRPYWRTYNMAMPFFGIRFFYIFLYFFLLNYTHLQEMIFRIDLTVSQ